MAPTWAALVLADVGIKHENPRPTSTSKLAAKEEDKNDEGGTNEGDAFLAGDADPDEDEEEGEEEEQTSEKEAVPPAPGGTEWSVDYNVETSNAFRVDPKSKKKVKEYTTNFTAGDGATCLTSVTATWPDGWSAAPSRKAQ